MSNCSLLVEEDYHRGDQPVILYCIGEDCDTQSYKRAYWPATPDKAEQVLAQIAAFLDIEIEIHIRVVDALEFNRTHLFKPLDIDSYETRIGDLYDILSAISPTKVGVLRIVIK